MVMIYVLSGVAVISVVMVIYVFFFKKGGEEIYVNFSEKIGGNIVEHPQMYKGVLNEKDDTLFIKKLNLKRPLPPRDTMTSTTTGKKMVSLIKFDNYRYGYRIPSIDNVMFTYQKDKQGNIIKKKGKPKLMKHRWNLCDDVVEPDSKHWDEMMEDKLRRRHEATKGLLERIAGPLSIALIFLFAVILLNTTTKELRADKNAIMEKAIDAEANAKQTSDNLNNLISKITGQRLFDDEELARIEYEKTLNKTQP